MKVNRYNGFKIILIGAGGTGGYIAPHLYRIAFASGCTARIIIADGDIVEEENLIRQNFVGRRWSVEREKRRNHSLVRAGRCGAGKFSTRSPGHDGFSRG